MRIVVGVDASTPSVRALKWASDEARAHDATLVVAHVYRWDLIGDPGGLGHVTRDHLAHDAEALIDRSVQALDAEGQDLNLERRAVGGAAGEMLVAMSADADLLVVGSHGTGAVGGFVLGSVSQYCARHATCPTVIVPFPRAPEQVEGS